MTKRQGSSRTGAHLKGKVFPSFARQEPQATERMEWVPGLHSTRQQIKNLSNKAHAILDSKDPEVQKAGARLIQLCVNEPDPKYTVLHLTCAALDASNDTGESWVTCIGYFMDKFEKAAANENPNYISWQCQKCLNNCVNDGYACPCGEPGPYAEESNGEEATKTEHPIQSGSRLRRLLRAIVPRTLRSSHEAAPEASVDQRAGAPDAEREPRLESPAEGGDSEGVSASGQSPS